MRLDVTSLGISQEVKEYTLSKEIAESSIKSTVDAKAVFSDADYDTLQQETISGKSKEAAVMNFKCGEDDVTINARIQHNQGSMNHKSCRYEKDIYFDDPTQCALDETINIFEYPSFETKSYQGIKDQYEYTKNIDVVYQPGEVPELNDLITRLGGIPVPDEGYFIQFIEIKTALQFNEFVEAYTNHAVYLGVTYVRLRSAVQFSDEWLPLTGGSEYYFSGFFPIKWNAPKYFYYDSVAAAYGLPTYITADYSKGYPVNIPDKNISNTINLNSVLQGAYECSGKTLVSNFFGINSDGTNPDNEVYDFASDLHNLRIVQAYDIIREAAVQDSFGFSGQIKVDELLKDIKLFFNLIDIYDADADVIRLEHITYYSLKGLDLVTNSVDHKVSDVLDVSLNFINSETWRMAAETPVSYETTIDYSVPPGESATEEYIIERFLVDVFGTINEEKYATSTYENLFYLLHTDGASIVNLNKELHIFNIVEKLHYYKRPTSTGTHDGEPVTFKTFSIGITGDVSFQNGIKTFKKLNPFNVIKTDQGTFLINKISYTQDGNFVIDISK